jgi:hypothetical protein
MLSGRLQGKSVSVFLSISSAFVLSTDLMIVQDHAFCLTFYRCVGYLVIGGKFNDALNIEKASFTDDVTDTFVASNFTTDNGYVADIIAKLGVKSFE